MPNVLLLFIVDATDCTRMVINFSEKLIRLFGIRGHGNDIGTYREWIYARITKEILSMSHDASIEILYHGRRENVER